MDGDISRHWEGFETAIVAGLGFVGEATEAWVCQLSQPRVAERRVERRGMETTSHCTLGLLYGLEPPSGPWAP